MSKTWGTVYQSERDKILGNDPESLRAEIERLKEELAIHVQAVGVSEWRRQECLRLRAALEEIIKEVGTSTLAAKIAREALNYGLPTAEDVRGILNEQLTK